MSTAIYEETKKDIAEAYSSHNKSKIAKETSFIFNQLFVTMLSSFKDRLIGISIESLDFKEDYITSVKNHENLSEWLDRFYDLTLPLSDLEFGKLKIDFEYWYYQLGGKEIHFLYREDYLLKPNEVAKELGISTVTLNKYIKQGLECVDTKNHNKIPKHSIDIWKDSFYSIKMQMLYQEKKMRKQTPHDRIQEINQELLEFQLKYKKKKCDEAFIDCNINELDDPSDYFEWRDLEEEKETLISKLIGSTEPGDK
ncbi:hypothetical protein AMS59_06925 [Lysinibacillus sp. FJAT-14745]|uniref:helix-turn-helix domain-containing protein n=1 Tax=Lysinibacillus sp. FJAT-14745 TaxID=1704289 RepID=UPI0006AB9E91|nr:helix-turn-helix domain-containing protein [Lysinibacillus sp. FJAT-14745]KOP79561.1 hypothetical protein AMS59_06925 [Lysinibacillus sp. FJAT-14745]